MSKCLRLGLAVAVLCGTAFSRPASAQGAMILRPSPKIADSARIRLIAPELAGYRLGEALRGALGRLGAPLRVDTLGTETGIVSYANLASGVTLIGTDSDGVGIILTTNRGAGALDSIRVGDTQADVVARWGLGGFHRRPPGGGDGLWLSGENVIVATVDDNGLVVRLGIGHGLSQ